MKWLLLLWLLSNRPDPWANFHPELVRNYSCKVQDVEMHANDGPGMMVWIADASAERGEDGKWAMMIGEFSHTMKGRHQAEKTCSAWMDEATRRIKKAQIQIIKETN
jgi:hypothetical protein